MALDVVLAGLELQVRHRLDDPGRGFRDIGQLVGEVGDHRGSLVGVAHPDEAERDILLHDGRVVRRLSRCGAAQVPPAPHRQSRMGDRVVELRRDRVPGLRVQRELELGDDAEVAAAAA